MSASGQKADIFGLFDHLVGNNDSKIIQVLNQNYLGAAFVVITNCVESANDVLRMNPITGIIKSARNHEHLECADLYFLNR